MTTTTTPTTLAERVQAARRCIEMGNNGYADIGDAQDVIAELQAQGYAVIRTRNVFGAAVHRGFTPRAQRALQAAPFGVSTYRPFAPALDAPDYESLILAQQSRLTGEL